MEFEDNDRLARLTGEHNQNLARLEAALDVTLDSFGNSITISGPATATKTARRALEDIYRQLGEREDIPEDGSLISDALRWAEAGSAASGNGQGVETWKKKIIAKTPGQRDYLALLRGTRWSSALVRLAPARPTWRLPRLLSR